jgi:hypothetical protein
MPKDYGASLEIPDLCGDYAWMSRIGREVGQAAWSNLLADFVTGAERTGGDADTRDVSGNHRAPAQAEAQAETGEVMACNSSKMGNRKTERLPPKGGKKY